MKEDEMISILKSYGNLDKSLIEKAISRALNSTAMSFRRSALLESSKDLRIKFALLKQRSKIMRSTAKKIEVGLSMLVFDLPAIFADAFATKQGVKTSHKDFERGFIGKTKKKKFPKRVLQRITKERFPLEELKIEIDDTVEDNFLREEARVDEIFMKNFRRELSFLAHGVSI